MTTTQNINFRFEVGTQTNHGLIVGRFLAPGARRIYVLSDTLTTTHWAERQLVEVAA